MICAADSVRASCVCCCVDAGVSAAAPRVLLSASLRYAYSCFGLVLSRSDILRGCFVVSAVTVVSASASLMSASVSL